MDDFCGKKQGYFYVNRLNYNPQDNHQTKRILVLSEAVRKEAVGVEIRDGATILNFSFSCAIQCCSMNSLTVFVFSKNVCMLPNL